MHRPRLLDYAISVAAMLISEAIVLFCIALLFAAGGHVPHLLFPIAVPVIAVADLTLLAVWPHGGYVAVLAEHRARRQEQDAATLTALMGPYNQPRPSDTWRIGETHEEQD